MVNLFRFIDWVMQLPEDLEEGFWREIQAYEEEKQMPYITSEDLVKTSLYPLSLGYALGLRWQAKGIRETPAYGGSILVGLALGGLLELAQLTVVSRSPDLTDVIICAAGTWAGTFLRYSYPVLRVEGGSDMPRKLQNC